MKILIVSKCPTHPTNAGNRWGVLAQAEILEKLGNEIHFLYVFELPLRQDVARYTDDLDKTREYWKERLHVYQVSKFEKLRFILKKIYRIKFCDFFVHVDDEYPRGLTRFVRKLKDEYMFDICIVNYYYLTKLFSVVRFDKMALFTHDSYIYKSAVVSAPDIQLTPNQEAKALHRCPYIFAVQDDEFSLFKLLSPKSRVFNIYSKYDYHQTPVLNNKNILFLSGNNSYNVNGIKWFINEILPLAVKKIPGCRLVIAGSICTILEKEYVCNPNIELMGYVNDPIELYSRGDVAINPVYQGTGLKIKTFEAISYGKITMVHPHSTIGIFDKTNAPLFYSDKPIEWVDFLERTWNNNMSIIEVKEGAERYLERMNDFIIKEYKRFLEA